MMETSLSTLTLEVVYRRFRPPIFKADESDARGQFSPARIRREESDKQKKPEKFDPIGIDEIEEPCRPNWKSIRRWRSPARRCGASGQRLSASAEAAAALHGPCWPPAVAAHRHTERAVTAALVWLANHQMADGSWSLEKYTAACKDKTCTGAGADLGRRRRNGPGPVALPRRRTNAQVHGPYKEHIRKGIEWLIAHQQPDGNLAKGGADDVLARPGHDRAGGGLRIDAANERGWPGAQGAVNFILAAQNLRDGGWRYNPGDPGDTSVTGWQLMALTIASMAGLNVGAASSPAPASSSIPWPYTTARSIPTSPAGLLADDDRRGPAGPPIPRRQRDNPMLTGGMKYLMGHLPDENFPNIYYWYYGTQVMHNMSGYEWDTWNRKMRDLLVRTQVRNVDQCVDGSRDPAKDAWGKRGGGLMDADQPLWPVPCNLLPLPAALQDRGRTGARNKP